VITSATSKGWNGTNVLKLTIAHERIVKKKKQNEEFVTKRP
jgi:hypothetical protein